MPDPEPHPATHDAASPGEFEAIARYFAPLAGPEGLGLQDDAALYIPPPGQSLVFTKDAMVAGVHFFADEKPSLVARKLMRTNLSDLAAMGAEPVGYLLSVAVPKQGGSAWIADFAAGLAADQSAFGWRLFGGDTVRTDGPITLSLTAIGSVFLSKTLRRNAARPGDLIYVSGTIGDAALGLRARQGGVPDLDPEARAFLIDRFNLPSPRLALGQRLAGLAHAAMDVSDGIAADLGHIATASAMAARLFVDRIPLSAAVRAAVEGDQSRFEWIFQGDDYELLFTAPATARDQIAQLSKDLSLALTEVGEVIEGNGVFLLNSDRTPAAVSGAGYCHF